MIPVSISIALFLVASTSVPALEPYSVLLRILGAIALIVPAMMRKPRDEQVFYPRLHRALVVVGLGFATYLLASTFVHDQMQKSVLGLASFALVAFLIHVISTRYSHRQLIGGVYVATLGICLLSLLAYDLMPQISIENFRLRGLMENANGLGFVALVLAAVSIAGRMRIVLLMLGLVCGLTCMVLSGSRASLLALVVIALILAFRGIRSARAALALIACATMMSWLLAPEVFARAIILRTTNTRSAGLQMLEYAMSESFWVGLGRMPTGLVVAGSPFAAGTTGGIIGIIGLCIIYFGLLRCFAPAGPRAFALVAGGLVHSMFEAWMLSFSAPMLLVFLVVLVGFVKLDAAMVGAAVLVPVASNQGYSTGAAVEDSFTRGRCGSAVTIDPPMNALGKS